MEKSRIIKNLQSEHSINLGTSHFKSLVLIMLFVLVFFALISGINAKNFNSTSDINDIQTFLSNENENDNKLILDGGDYNSLSNLNVSRSINISSNGQVNIRGTGGTLFSITSKDVIIVNLNISGYATAMRSNTGGLSVTGCNISTTDMSIELTGSSLTDILLENDTIISAVKGSNYCSAVYINATKGSVVSATLKDNYIIVNSASNSDYGVIFDIVGCDNTLNFINNDITGNWAGILLFAWNSNNTITITNNKITGNWYSVEVYGNRSDNNILITNNNITAAAREGVFIYADYSNNALTITNNNITSTARYGLYLFTLDSNNTITVTKNNIAGSWAGVYLYAYRSNNAILSFVGNNIVGSKYAMYIYSYRNFVGLSLSNNTFKSDDVGLHFALAGATLGDISVTGNTIVSVNKAIAFEESNPSFVKISVNYNRILADIGLDFATNNNGSNFDYNWWGVNDITDKIVNFVTTNHYILNITNLNSLDNVYVGDKLDFAFLVLNTTLTNEGVENLPYFIISGSFNGISYHISTNDLFVHQFAVLTEKMRTISAFLDGEHVNLDFNVYKRDLTIVAEIPNGTVGETVNVAIRLNETINTSSDVVIGDMTYKNVVFVNGLAIISFTITSPLSGTVDVTFVGNNVYNSVSTLVDVNFSEEDDEVDLYGETGKQGKNNSNNGNSSSSDSGDSSSSNSGNGNGSNNGNPNGNNGSNGNSSSSNNGNGLGNNGGSSSANSGNGNGKNIP